MSADDSETADWKLKLRYGRLKTPYSHFSIIAEGVMITDENDFRCPKGSAFMGMKAWASSADEATDMIRSIGGQLRFEVSGRVYVYDTPAVKPPREDPFGYDIKFTPFDESEKDEPA